MSEDDPSVSDSTDLFRRVHPEQVIWDDNVQRLRPTTAVFRDTDMSVSIGDTLAKGGRSPESTLGNRPHHHLVALTALEVRNEEQVVCREPRPEDDSHGGVVGSKPKTRRTVFALQARWEVLREGSLPPNLRMKLNGA